MNKFDVRNIRFIGILLGICFIFIMVVVSAFDYLPQNTEEDYISSLIKEENKQAESVSKDATDTSETNEEEQIEISDEDIDEPVTKIQAKPKQDIANIEPLEIISDNEITSGENISAKTPETPISKARALKSDKQYSSAIVEYENIIRTTSDPNLKATCYEEVATIYGIQRRYGSALSAAQKAYNLAPTSSREILLARLYYKTGDLNKATERVNNVLKRDFNTDD